MNEITLKTFLLWCKKEWQEAITTNNLFLLLDRAKSRNQFIENGVQFCKEVLEQKYGISQENLIKIEFGRQENMDSIGVLMRNVSENHFFL